MKNGNDISEEYSQNFLRVLNRLTTIGKSEISFDKYIDFEREIFLMMILLGK